jgi:head-tail adaptor
MYGTLMVEWHFSISSLQATILMRRVALERSYCSACKAELQVEQVVAVKKLHAGNDEAHDEERFQDEVEMLTKIWQRSIVKLYGYIQ